MSAFVFFGVIFLEMIHYIPGECTNGLARLILKACHAKRKGGGANNQHSNLYSLHTLKQH